MHAVYLAFFTIMRFPLKMRGLFLYFYFTRENKIKKENLKCDSIWKKQVRKKPSLGLGVMLFIKKVRNKP